ncbi:hypothetical protein KBA73_02640 [Patescibacteria group bacterium]|nr:hypothetical protein [Patescibacteria group bacterium]
MNENSVTTEKATVAKQEGAAVEKSEKGVEGSSEQQMAKLSKELDTLKDVIKNAEDEIAALQAEDEDTALVDPEFLAVDFAKLDKAIVDLQAKEAKREELVAQIAALEASLTEAAPSADVVSESIASNEAASSEVASVSAKEAAAVTVEAAVEESQESLLETLRALSREIDAGFENREKLSNTKLESSLRDRKISGYDGRSYTLKERIDVLHPRFADNWVDECLSPNEQAGLEELQKLENSRDLDAQISEATAQRIKGEMPANIAAIKTFFNKWHDDFEGDGSKSDLVESSMFKEDKNILDEDGRAYKTEQLKKVVAEGRKLIAEKLGIKSTNPDEISSKYYEVMEAWNVQRSTIGKQVEQDFSNKKARLETAYKSALERIKALPDYQHDMEIIKRTREALTPLISKYTETQQKLEDARAKSAAAEVKKAA